MSLCGPVFLLIIAANLAWQPWDSSLICPVLKSSLLERLYLVGGQALPPDDGMAANSVQTTPGAAVMLRHRRTRGDSSFTPTRSAEGANNEKQKEWTSVVKSWQHCDVLGSEAWREQEGR